MRLIYQIKLFKQEKLIYEATKFYLLQDAILYLVSEFNL